MERGARSLGFSVGEMVGTLDTSVRDHGTSHLSVGVMSPRHFAYPPPLFLAHGSGSGYRSLGGRRGLGGAQPPGMVGGRLPAEAQRLDNDGEIPC